MELVASAVALDLAFPPCSAGFRQAEVGALFVAVPEAPVNEDDGAVFWQDEIGFAGQVLVFWTIDGEAVAKVVEHRAQGQFRLCVVPPDAGHER